MKEMNWQADISRNAQAWMKLLGEFSPTNNPYEQMLKGVVQLEDEEGSHRIYLELVQIREIAKAFNEAAEWLEKRALIKKQSLGLEK